MITHWYVYNYLFSYMYSLHWKSVDVDIRSSDIVSVNARYAPEVICTEEINVILDHLETALLSMIDHPNGQICDVELINEREMRLTTPVPHLVSSLEQEFHPLAGEVKGRNGSSPYPVSNSVKSMPGLLGLQISRTPQRIAVSKYIRVSKQTLNLFIASIRSGGFLDL